MTVLIQNKTNNFKAFTRTPHQNGSEQAQESREAASQQNKLLRFLVSGRSPVSHGTGQSPVSHGTGQNPVSHGTGFTLIELIIVITIIIITILATIPFLGNMYVISQLDEASVQVAQVLRIARERALAGEGNKEHGVKIETDRFVLYKGSSYGDPGKVIIREVVLDDVLNISSTQSDIIFSKALGEPNIALLEIITLDHTGLGSSKQITINEFGKVEIN